MPISFDERINVSDLVATINNLGYVVEYPVEYPEKLIDNSQDKNILSIYKQETDSFLKFLGIRFKYKVPIAELMIEQDKEESNSFKLLKHITSGDISDLVKTLQDKYNTRLVLEDVPYNEIYQALYQTDQMF